MTEIVITEFMEENAVERLSRRYQTIYEPDLAERPAELAGVLARARALIVRNRTQVRGEVLASGRRIECVGRLGVGLDNIDLATCRMLGITVYPTTGANDVAVAEYVIATSMILMRKAYRATALVYDGKWPRQQLIGREISGRTIGLIGYGAIAREVARRAEALGMTVIAYDPHLDSGSPIWRGTGQRDLNALLEEADIVSLHTPLTPESRGLIGADQIVRMKRDAVLINAARGGIVDDGAVVAALKSGRLGGAALDVFAQEPVDAKAGRVYSGVPNLILTPHIAGLTHESNVRVSDLIADRVLAHLDRQ